MWYVFAFISGLIIGGIAFSCLAYYYLTEILESILGDGKDS